MMRLNRATKILKNFKADRKGGIAIMTGLIFPVVFVGAGGALDYNNAVTTTQKAQRALDSTVLALARRDLDTIDIQTEGDRLFRSVLQSQSIQTDPKNVEFTLDGDSITGSGVVESQTFFLGLLGMDKFKGRVEAVAIPAIVEPIEVSLVLDVSGSMRNDLNGRRKIDVLKDGVNAMFDTLDRVLPDNAELSAALVPYSSAVNLGDYPQALETLSITGEQRPLVGDDVWAAERSQSENGTNFTINDASPIGRPIPFATRSDFASDEIPTLPRLAALTDDTDSVRTAVNGLEPAGFTAGHTGMAWGIYSLSERWASIWPQDPKPADQSNKIIVMLTDGQFNRTLNIGAQNRADTLHSDAYFRETCELAQRLDITIYTIALDLDPANEARLQNCVGPNGAFFSADNADDLTDAFEEIARRLGAIRLTS